MSYPSMLALQLLPPPQLFYSLTLLSLPDKLCVLPTDMLISSLPPVECKLYEGRISVSFVYC